MGSTVAQYSDVAVVTSDNPRSEDPLLIIEAILEGISAESTTIEVIPDRRAAIELALRIAEPRDVVVIAGKGHEQGQIINGQTFPFDDVAVATELLQAATGEATA
jgi:UDP-N-acetylmuramoyl-L-alanyl-D-glutamate--2,6-diaminopimelate ligase